MLFFLLRGYFGERRRAQRAREAFKQNLEAATINPARCVGTLQPRLDSSNTVANLMQASERFERAIRSIRRKPTRIINSDGCALSRKRLAEAIGHFEQVVRAIQYHSQNEIWREIGATYIAAGQFADAREALQKFLERSENDPQGLYLMGRAYAGLGDQRRQQAQCRLALKR